VSRVLEAHLALGAAEGLHLAQESNVRINWNGSVYEGNTRIHVIAEVANGGVLSSHQLNLRLVRIAILGFEHHSSVVEHYFLGGFISS
jgi:bisphosphoglycerate-independent phosphoglycerate mutase (AlkP superfamily)